LRKQAIGDDARRAVAESEALAKMRASTELAQKINQAAGDVPLAFMPQVSNLLLAQVHELALKPDVDAKTALNAARMINDSARIIQCIHRERVDASNQHKNKMKERKKGISPEVSATIRARIEGPDPETGLYPGQKLPKNSDE